MKRSITAKERRALIDQLEASFQAVGVELYSGARRLKALIDDRYPMLAATQSREALEAYLAADLLTPEDEAALAMAVPLLAAIPVVATLMTQDAVRQAAEALPSQAGPPVKLDAEQKLMVIGTVRQFYGTGCSIGVAQMRAARQTGVSKRTVQRIWQHRAKFAEQPFQSPKQVIDALLGLAGKNVLQSSEP